MKWEDNVRSRFFYRGREHQLAQHKSALAHAGDLEGKSVLDVGCGYGDLLWLLPPCHYRGIDTNKLAIEEARRLWPDHDFAVTKRVRRSDVVLAIATLQCCADKRGALLRWISAARERLVVVTCTWDRLPPEDQGEEWWEGIDREAYPSDDDFVTYVVLP